MSRLRPDLLFLAAAVGAVAYVVLARYGARHLTPWARLERRWAEDVVRLEESGRLPPEWARVKSVHVIGGTPETRDWLRRIHVPLKTDPRGEFQMDALVVVWREAGKTGALVQYNIADAKTGNLRAEIARTLILSTPDGEPWLPRLDLLTK